MSQLLKDENGQAVVEYVLMLMFVLGAVGAMGMAFRKALFKMWSDITQKTAAPSPLGPYGDFRLP